MVKDIYSISYKMKRELYSRIWTVFMTVVTCILVVSLITAFLIYPVNSKSDSMDTDIPENSVVLVTPLLRKPSRGQIMLITPTEQTELSFFKKTLNFFCRFFTAQQCSPFISSEDIAPSLRRVIGLPGDTIFIKDHLVYVKPAGKSQFLTEFELTNIRYSLTVPEISTLIDKSNGALGVMEQITLKDGEYFFLGDNRAEAIDSRIWGPVSSSDIKGRALLIYLPFSKARFF